MADQFQFALTDEAHIEPELLALCKSIAAKRPRTVIQHILEHGMITNEELSELYNYDHPPRAIRDVRENGIPLITHSITSPKTGRKIAAYTFGSLKDIQHGRVGGRRAFPKQFKNELVARYGSRDTFTQEPLEERYLQIDHRIPYEISGDSANLDTVDFMLLDASSQRAKSWSCEHCANFKKYRDITICQTCFWARPESYSHVAMEQKRRVELTWSGAETAQFDHVQKVAEQSGIDIQTYIKKRLSE